MKLLVEMLAVYVIASIMVTPILWRLIRGKRDE